MCLNTTSPEFIIWVATGIAKGYIQIPEVDNLKVFSQEPTPLATGVYQEKDEWWYFRERSADGDYIVKGPYSERGAKMVYTKFCKDKGWK